VSGHWIGSTFVPIAMPRKIITGEGFIHTIEPADLPIGLRARGILMGTRAGRMVQRIESRHGVQEAIEAIVEGVADPEIDPETEDEAVSASWRVLEPARTAQESDLARSPRSMIKDAQNRFWSVSATVARAVGVVRRKIDDPDDPGTKVFRRIEVEHTSVKVVFRSPMDDVLVAVWTTPDEPKATAEVKAWGHSRGVMRPLDISTAKKWIKGPWSDLMENSGFVPAWKREIIAEAKRKAKPGVCSGCGAAVLIGLDQGVWEAAGLKAVVDAEPLAGPYQLLAEVACWLEGRKVFSLFGLGSGIELAGRDDFSIGWTKYPAHVEHRCGDPIRLAA
jgi:hypothetical protein